MIQVLAFLEQDLQIHILGALTNKATTGILAKYDQRSMYIQPHSMVDQVSFSLSSFKQASIFFMQKGESMQTKTQPQ